MTEVVLLYDQVYETLRERSKLDYGNCIDRGEGKGDGKVAYSAKKETPGLDIKQMY